MRLYGYATQDSASFSSTPPFHAKRLLLLRRDRLARPPRSAKAVCAMGDALPLLVVFGATGATGTHVVRHALADGTLRVRALVRSPEKLPEEVKSSPNFEFVTGTFTDYEKVAAACEGATYVVSVAGNADLSKKGPFMEPFVKAVIEACENHGVERVMYQAGGLSPAPGEPLPLTSKIMRWTLAPVLGISAMVAENDAAIDLLAKSKLKWVVSRPGMLSEMPSKGVLKTVPNMGGSLAFNDLAQFTLEAVQSDSYDGTAPCLDY